MNLQSEVLLSSGRMAMVESPHQSLSSNRGSLEGAANAVEAANNGLKGNEWQLNPQAVGRLEQIQAKSNTDSVVDDTTHRSRLGLKFRPN